MPELLPADRIMPALFDRLCDDAPDKQDESRNTRVISTRQLRDCVQRDLSWLLGTTHLEALVDLDEVPEVAKSVVNYGVPGIAGGLLNRYDVAGLSSAIRTAIQRYEPRLLPGTVKVTVMQAQEKLAFGALSFTIEGRLWAQPAPIRLLLKTDIDLDIGSVTVTDIGSG